MRFLSSNMARWEDREEAEGGLEEAGGGWFGVGLLGFEDFEALVVVVVVDDIERERRVYGAEEKWEFRKCEIEAESTERWYGWEREEKQECGKSEGSEI